MPCNKDGTRKKPGAYKMKYTKGGFPFRTDLTKKPTGPIAEKKEVKEDNNVPLSPGFEDPIKIQKVQREGITPHSQKFSKKAKANEKFKGSIKYSDLEKHDDDR